MPRKVAFPCQGLSTEVADPSASSGVARARAPTGAKFVGIQAKVDILTSKAIVFKGQSEVVRRVRLPLDPLPLVCTSSA